VYMQRQKNGCGHAQISGNQRKMGRTKKKQSNRTDAIAKDTTGLGVWRVARRQRQTSHHITEITHKSIRRILGCFGFVFVFFALLLLSPAYTTASIPFFCLVFCLFLFSPVLKRAVSAQRRAADCLALRAGGDRFAGAVLHPKLLGGTSLLRQRTARAARVTEPVDAAARVRQAHFLEQR